MSYSLAHAAVGRVPDVELAHGILQALACRQVVVTPFPYYGAVLQEQEPRVASYNGLKRGLVGHEELVFGTGDVFPVLNVFLRGSGEAVERNALLLTILVYLVDVAEVGVVGVFKVWRY